MKAAPTDRRRERHVAKQSRIVGEAWKLARRDGLAAISLRDLAAQVDLRQPSLYAYFDSKLALYDAMFADANRQLLAMAAALPEARRPDRGTHRPGRGPHPILDRRPCAPPTPVPATGTRLRAVARVLRIALAFYELASERLKAAGASSPDDLDLFTAIVAGLSHQQVANDPGGDRWVRLSRRAVEMYLADVERQSTTDGTIPRKATS